METLAALEPSPFPVISLYLSLTPNQVGREDFDLFVRKVFKERAHGFRAGSPERESFDKNIERITRFLDTRDAAWNGVAIFACAGTDLFETIPLDTPFDDHWMFVGSEPHLYPLAKLVDTFPRYAAVVLDTNSARIIVYSMASTERVESIQSDKTRRSQKGGWSQARYQRRADNVHMHHMKDVVDALDRIVREEQIGQIVIAAQEVALPKLREQLPGHLAGKIVDTITIQPGSQGGNLLEATFAAIRDKDAETDAEKVDELIGEWRSGVLGVTGPEATLRAFELGQVEELIITGSVEALKPVQKLPDDAPADMKVETSDPAATIDEPRLKLSAELIKRAQQTAAHIRFIEDATLLQEVGGVGALLRFRI